MQIDAVCSTPHGWNMHLVRMSSFLLSVLLMITVACSHAVYHSATSDQHQCQCCSSVPITVLWLISKDTVRIILNTSGKSHCWGFCGLYWWPDGRWVFSGLKIWNSSCVEICLLGSYNMQFSFISACYWRSIMRVLMLGAEQLSLERQYKHQDLDFLEGRADINPWVSST